VRVFIVLALLGQAPAPELMTPEQVWSAAFLNLMEKTEPEDRRYTRYLSLHTVEPAQRETMRKVLDFATNVTSWRSEFSHVEPVSDTLVRIDLRRYAWDFPSRSRRLAELERRGVNFGFKDAEERHLALDPWEQLARLDPYFESAHYDAGGHYVAGWIDRDRVNAARQVSYSLKPVLRAEWIVAKLQTERSFGGIYSDVMLFPPKEADFYKAFLIDVDAVQKDNQLLHGGAVLKSAGVALNPRELQLLPSPYGKGGVSYLWRTLDVPVDARSVKNDRGGTDVKNPIEGLRGTFVHDGRESLGTNPNGLQWAQLYNNSSKKAGGTGDRVDVVPENIAQVFTPIVPPRDTRVVNYYKCLECHLSGVKDFEDVIRKMFLNKQAVLQAKAKDPYAAAALAEALDEYYASDLGQTIHAQQDAYDARLKAACGMNGRETATNVVGAVEVWLHDPVSPQQMAVDMGENIDFARLAWMAGSVDYVSQGVQYKGNPQLTAPLTGESLSRGIYEQSFADMMRASVELRRKIGAKPKAEPTRK
jgi:hypothetical protein